MCLVLGAGFIYRIFWYFVQSATKIRNFGKIMHFLEASNSEMVNSEHQVFHKRKAKYSRCQDLLSLLAIDTCLCWNRHVRILHREEISIIISLDYFTAPTARRCLTVLFSFFFRLFQNFCCEIRPDYYRTIEALLLLSMLSWSQ